MKKYLFIIDRMEGGGAERQMLKVASLCTSANHVSILCLHKPSSSLAAAAELSGVEVISKHCKYEAIILRFLCYLRLAFFLFFHKRKEGVDCCVSFLEVSNVLNVLSGGRKTILGVRNHLTSQYQHNAVKLFLARLSLSLFYNRANLVVCNSSAIREDLVVNFRICADLVDIIYNVYDFKAVREYAAQQVVKYPRADLGRVFLFCGRLSPQKGADVLIKTFSAFIAQSRGVVNARLVIVGDGELNAELRELASEFSENIFFYGHQDNPYPYFVEADYLVLTSNFEGFPNVVTEAVILGCCPLVVDCLSGPREIVSGFQKIDYDEPMPNICRFDYGYLYQRSIDRGVDSNLMALFMDPPCKVVGDIWRFEKDISNLGAEKWERVLSVIN